ADENDDRVADDIADDREKAAEKRQADNDRAIGQSDEKDEDRGQHRIDRRDRHLGADDGGKAAVKFAEARRDLVAVNRIEIVLELVGFTEEIEPAIEEQAHRADDRDDDENEGRRSVAGEISENAEVTRLVSDRRHGRGLK